MTAPPVTAASAASLPAACEFSSLLRRITRGELLSILGIGVFAEVLTVGWIALVLGVDHGRATWAQAVGMAGVDLMSLLWLPIPLFALYDAFPLTGTVRTQHLVIRLAGAGSVVVLSAMFSRWAAHVGGRLLGIEPSVLQGITADFREQLFWAGCGVVGVSLTYLVLRRLHRARELEHRNAELQRLTVAAQLAALSSELRPHFLFNAINNLAELVHHDPARTEAMLLHLSSLLQSSLVAVQRRTVPLAEELAHVDDYLALQQLRFEERLTVQRDIAPSVLGTPVPPMLLQPLVENAIVHGIEGRVGATMVAINARAVNGLLEMQVDDDGPGPHRSAHVGTGTGLRNVRERLAALYGGAASVTLEERLEGGARLTVRLPLEAA